MNVSREQNRLDNRLSLPLNKINKTHYMFNNKDLFSNILENDVSYS